MAELICKNCGYPNPEGAGHCEICDEPLAALQQEQVIPTMGNAAAAPVMASGAAAREYFVICPESNHRTVIDREDQTHYFCQGCKKEHEIDGFIWVVESVERADAPQVSAAVQPAPQPKSNKLRLEEMRTHYVLEIDPPGGTVGRYAQFGADFFQSNNMLYVSGTHCAVVYQYENWCIQHLSRTNQTCYDGQILDHGQTYLLEDGKQLTLANAVSFIVHIG